MTVAEGILAYVNHLSTYGPQQASAVITSKSALRAVRRLYGSENLFSFGPLALQTAQQAWVKEGITRGGVNRRTSFVRRWAKWLVSQELVGADFHQRLVTVSGLRLGRTTAPDNPPVKPADPADLEKALAVMPAMIASICRLQTLSAARCGELLKMKSADIDRTGTIWTYAPTIHKGTWRGKGRTICFGPEAQAVLAPLIPKAGDGYIFSPARSEAERIAVNSANRKTPRWPSHMKRNGQKRLGTSRKRPPGERYCTNAVRKAIERACDMADVPRFTPHRLRHLAALTAREKFGLEHARAMLGHSVASMTAHYSRSVDNILAGEVAAKIG